MTTSLLSRWCRRLAGALVVVLALGHAAGAIEIKQVKTPKGVTAWLIEDKTVPLLSMEFAFRGGSALDPEGKAGLAELVSGLLDEGAGELSSAQFQRRLENNSISLGFRAALDSFGGTLRTLSEHRDMAFSLLHLALSRPRFDAEPVARMKSQVMAQIAREAERARNIAQQRWQKEVFGEHPYGRDVDGQIKTIRAITTDDLRGFVSGRFARDNLIIGIVGDITEAELVPLLDRTFGALPEKAASYRVPDVLVTNAGKLIVVPRKIPQTVVVFGQKALPITDPDYYAATVMNYIMGGDGLTSRLADEVREKRGLAYSVYTRIVNYDRADVILGWVATQNAKVAESLKLIRAEWARMASTPVSQSELDDAKNYLTGSYFTRLNSTRRIASLLVGLQLDKLGIDYLQRRNKLIAAVTVADVQRVARRVLQPEALTVVMVGSPEGVTATP
jgi:zinc protease